MRLSKRQRVVQRVRGQEPDPSRTGELMQERYLHLRPSFRTRRRPPRSNVPLLIALAVLFLLAVFVLAFAIRQNADQ